MSQEESIGYGQPPRSTRFRKGQSGNPRGRPKNRHRDIPYDAVLGQMVTMRENGKERRVTAAEAFLLQLTQKGLAGDSSAARDALEAIEAARSARGESEQKIDTLVLRVVDSGVDVIIEPLGIAVLKYPAMKPAPGSNSIHGSWKLLLLVSTTGGSLLRNSVRSMQTLARPIRSTGPSGGR